MRRTEEVEVKVEAEGFGSKLYRITGEGFQELMDLLQSKAIAKRKKARDFIPAEEVFPDLADPEKRPAAVLRGFRHRDGLTQVELAKRLGVAQGDISGMENGTRGIGKDMAQRLGKVFKADYRVFL